MLSKFSVKRPYTVLVGVLLILILGFVSITKMTTDLLPSMNLPYAVVYTTYIGASPEEVETTVTRPVESSMATISNIKNIQSVSSENVSMVILEFEQTANMDSVTIEMRESLDQISASWSDSIGSPVIMKLNPDMMPIMIAAVNRDGMDSLELTDYVNNELLAQMESIEGVASVSMTGGIEETLQVVLTESKIEEKNQEVRDALDRQFADARKELTDARDQIEDGLAQVDSGSEQLSQAQEQIAAGQQELASQIAQAKGQTDTQKMQLLETKMQLTNQAAQLADQLAELTTTESQLSEVNRQWKDLKNRQKELETAHENYKALSEKYVNATAELADYEAQIAAIRLNPEFTDEEKEQKIAEIQASEGYLAAQQAVKDVEQQFAILGTTPEEIAKILAENELAYQALTPAISGLEELVSSMGYDINALDQYLQEIADGKAQLEGGIAQIQDAIKQLDAGQLAIADAEVQISAGEASGNLQLYTALAQTIAGEQGLESTKAQLESGLTQIEEGEKQIDDSAEQAYEQADLTTILTRDMVSGILQAENFSMPAGYVAEDGTQVLIRVGDKFDSAEALRNTVILDMGFDGVEPIRLGDVAEVDFIDNSDEVYASINGNPGLMLTMQKQTGYSTGEVSKKIQERMNQLSEQTPGLEFTILMDQGIYIDYIVNSVVENMLFGAVLAILVLALFLKSVRPTIVIAFSIPISLIAAIVLMYFSNITLNIISLSGLALGVGMLVDNSIVVIENIYRMRSEGVSPKKAAVEGARQVGGAIVASTLTTCCVFLPIVFTEGITRQLFVDMGLTIAYALLASLLIAMTVVPAMAAGILRKGELKPNRLFDRLQLAYSRSIAWILNHRLPVLLLAILLLVVSMRGAFLNGTSFMPSMESTQISATLTTDETCTLQETAEISEQVMEQILTISDVETVGAMSGGNGMSLMGMGGSSSSNSVSMYIILKEKQTLTNAEVKSQILEKTADLPCELSVTTESMDMSALGGSGIQIQVQGKELETLQKIASDVASLVENVEGTDEVSDGMEESTPELRIVVNKEKAMEYKQTVAQIYSLVYAKLSESVTSTTLSTESKDYPVLILDGEAEEFTTEDVKNMTVTVTDSDGKSKDIPLSDLVDFQAAEGLNAINRINQNRTLTVTASASDGYNVGLVGSDVRTALDGYSLPDGYSITMAGENETINEAMIEMIKMILLAVAFVYLVMVAQFQSLKSPMIIMFTIPLAFTGGFLGLIVAGMEVSIIAMIGFVMLTGVIVNNGIVLVDYINQLRRGGMKKTDAIIEAGKTRLRPIMMTALTTILGLVTLAMGMGMGADMVQPMAVVTIGGLIYGTFMTLWVVPVIYDLFNKEKDMTEEEL